MKADTTEFLNQFDDTEFPTELLAVYEPLELLSQNEYSKTYLLQDKKAKTFFVAKSYSKAVCDMGNCENVLLKNLSHEGLPKTVAEYQTEEDVFCVREFISGTPLDQYLKENSVNETAFTHIISCICDILSYLHNQPEPIIHRDIKPSNIIIEGESITLIDFGISRKYKENAGGDTLHLGTKGFAPPEQYGFGQTDSRADIYAVGILMLFMLTGSVDLSAAESVRNKRLKTIIKKAAAFAPKDRYKSATAIKSELLGKSVLKRKWLYGMGFAAVAVIIAVIVFSEKLFVPSANVNSDIPSQASENSMSQTSAIQADVEVEFQTPLIEKAVRQALMLGDTDKIMQSRIDTIEKLYIAGEHPTTSEPEYYKMLDSINREKGEYKRGNIENLSDFAKMPNLIVLCITYQNISDLTPLQPLNKLQKLDVQNNPVNKLTPLSAMTSLESLHINRLTDPDSTPLNSLTKMIHFQCNNQILSSYAFLSNLPLLINLDLSFAPPDKVLPYLQGHTVTNFSMCHSDIHSLNGFEKINGIEKLVLENANLTDISAITQMKDLISVNLAYNKELKDLSPLLSLPDNTTVTLSHDMDEAIAACLGSAKFTIIYQ